MQKIYVWFHELGNGLQFHQKVLLLVEHVCLWLRLLSVDQKWVVFAVVAIVLLSAAALFRIFYRQWRSLRLWYRRRKIPQSVDLKLDRDATSSFRKR